MLLKERRERAQQIVQSVETSLVSQNGQLRQAVLDFREAFLDDVWGDVLVEIWPRLFGTEGWGWLEEHGFPVFARNEMETVFLGRLDERLRSARANQEAKSE